MSKSDSEKSPKDQNSDEAMEMLKMLPEVKVMTFLLRGIIWVITLPLRMFKKHR